MTGYVTTAAGVRLSLPPPLSWEFEYTSGAPCDSFHLVCPWDRDNTAQPGDWVGFFAQEDGQRVFTGVVDECQASIGRTGSRLEVTGRGMAALLLDNEALGQDYLTATLEDIVRDHVAPYGIELAKGASLPGVSQFSVAAGSSEWTVVYEFARYYGGVTPRFDREGRLVLTPWARGRELLVDESTPVTELVRRDKRYGVLSEVWVRDRYTGSVERVESPAFRAQGGRRRRVMTMPGRSSYKAMRYSGQFQLERSAAEQVQVEVEIPILFYGQPGDLVRLNRPGCLWNGQYRAASARVGADGGGAWTRLELIQPQAVL